MKIKGRENIEKVDVLLYNGIYNLADNKIKKIDEELIPTFIIEESLDYFCELEKYEVCQKIKSFFKEHTSYIIQSSREEWYGIVPIKKQKS